MASIQVEDDQVEEVTKPTAEKPELNSPAIDENVETGPPKGTETSPYFDEDEAEEDKVKEVDNDEENQEKLAAPQIIDEEDQDEDGVDHEPGFYSGGARRGGNEFSEEEDDGDHADD